jgi:hypothetical protein
MDFLQTATSWWRLAEDLIFLLRLLLTIIGGRKSRLPIKDTLLNYSTMDQHPNSAENDASEHISIFAANLPFKDFLLEIEQQCQIIFHCDKAVMRKIKAVNLSLKEVPVEQALDAALSSHPNIHYIRDGKKFYIMVISAKWRQK